MPIAKNIKFCRKKSNLTQQQLADSLGVSKATIASWESKKTAVPVPSAKRVAEFFCVEFNELCDLDLERLENEGHDIKLSDREKQGILMFRALPEDIKALIRQTIISAYERNRER